MDQTPDLRHSAKAGGLNEAAGREAIGQDIPRCKTSAMRSYITLAQLGILKRFGAAAQPGTLKHLRST